MLRSATIRPTPRRGAILLVVLVMLSLFAVIGLSFVLYAESEATSARTYKDSLSVGGVGSFSGSGPSTVSYPDPKPALDDFFRQVVFSSGDTGTDTLSSLRGYDMARMVYGYRHNPSASAAEIAAENCIAYNGHGAFDEATSITGLQRIQVLNYGFGPGATTLFDPEYTGSRTSATAGTPPTTSYVGRNAAYTYPDRNNAYVALVDPNTGQVIAPSFVRPGLFDFSTGSPDWTSPAGRYKTVRPRPQDHLPAFPYIPANPDGSFTGDVQNLRFANGQQKNDSIWIDANLPPVQWRGRWIKPLVAPMIIPLDGRLNLNVAGATTPASNMGFGPWEQNLGTVTAATVVTGRQGAAPLVSRLGKTSLDFANIQPADYAKIDFRASGTAPMTLPTGTQSEPTYTGFDNGDSTVMSNHPGLWNPFEQRHFVKGGTVTAPATFPLEDLRQLTGHYSDRPRKYRDPYLGEKYPNELGETAGSGPNNAANITRALVTTLSNSLARPGLAPNFVTGSNASVLTLGANGYPTFATSPPTATFTGNLPDGRAGTPAEMRNVLAALGSVNLNRSLADYRNDTTMPLSDTNVTPVTFDAAWRDRVALATDIFARLIVVTGANATVNADGTIAPITATGAELNALRWLAQLSVNIVDFIDADDISTPFAWNPDGGDRFAATNFAAGGGANNKAVFGLEKPRLVINEVYAEIANNVADAGGNMGTTEDFQVRFFIELLNPGTEITTPNHPLAGPDTTPGNRGSVALKSGTISPYKVLVFDNGTTTETELAKVENVLGEVAGAKLDVKLDDLTGANATRIAPNNGQAVGGSGDQPGYVVVGPTFSMPGTETPQTMFRPDDLPNKANYLSKPDNSATDQLWYSVAQKTKMEFEAPTTGDPVVKPVGTTDQLNGDGTNPKRHAVVLQRLACPYMPADPNTNPYITVDYTAKVRINDAVRMVKAEAATNPTGGRDNAPTPASNFATGRVQPFAGQEAGEPNTATKADSLTMKQQPSPAAMSKAQTTLQRHNGQDAATPATDATLVTPFAWLAHFDRKLVNALDLLHVGAVPPHRLTHTFGKPGTTPTFQNHGLAYFPTPAAPAAPAAQLAGPLADTNSPLYRMFEALTVKPWTYGTPNGGRVAGRVNVNMIWDEPTTGGGPSQVFNAVLDPRPANGFAAADVQTIWTALKNSRTPGWTAPTTKTLGATTVEGGTDRPFRSFGAATFADGRGVQDTLLRVDTTTTGFPIFRRTDSAAAPLHPYQAWEPLKKAYNQFTTTSDCYLVLVTVGFFDVDPAWVPPVSVTNVPRLGAEAFANVPGDLRAQYVAVVDRTQIGVDQSGTQVANIWFAELAEQADVGATSIKVHTDPAGNVYDTNGTPVPLLGKTIRLGTGDATTNQGDGEWVAIPPMPPPTYDAATGVATFTVPPLTRTHQAGSPVSNGFLRNPGPQGGFEVTDAKYRGVLPFVARVPVSQ